MASMAEFVNTLPVTCFHVFRAMKGGLRRRKREPSAVYFSFYPAEKVWTGEALDEGDRLDKDGAVNCFFLHPRNLLASGDALQVLNELFWSWRRLYGRCDVNKVLWLRKVVAQGFPSVVI